MAASPSATGNACASIANNIAFLSCAQETENVILAAFYCNARSLRNNLTELHDLLYSGKFEFLCFSESWLNDDF